MNALLLGFIGAPGLAEFAIVAIPVALIVAAGTMLYVFRFSASLAGVDCCSLGQAFGSIVLGFFVALIAGALFSLLPVIGIFCGIVCGFLLRAGITSAILRTTFGTAFLTEILFLVMGIVTFALLALAVIVALGGGGLALGLTS